MMAELEIDLNTLRISDAQWRKRAEQELGETDDAIVAGIQELRKLIRANAQMSCCPLDSRFLLLFLRSKKFQVKESYVRLKNACNLLKDLSYLKPKMKIESLKHVYIQPFYSVADGPDDKGRTIATLMLGQWDPSTCSLDDLVCATLFLFHGLASQDHRIQVGGYCFVLDVSGLGLKHVFQLSRTFLLLLAHMFKECNPVRVNQIHIVNEGFLYDAMYASVRPFLGTKLKERIVLHGSNYQSTLHRQLPSEYLPSALGGTCPTFDIVPFVNKMKTIEESGHLKGLVDMCKKNC